MLLHIDKMLLLKREANTPAYLDVQALGRFAGDLIRGHSGRQRSPRVLATRRGPSCETEGGQGGCQPIQENASRKVEGSNHGTGKVFHLVVSLKWLLTKSLACSTLNCVSEMQFIIRTPVFHLW